MVDLGSLVLLTSIFGAKVATGYVLLGLVVAIIGGTLIERLHMEKHVEEFVTGPGVANIESPSLTLAERVTYAKEQVVSTFSRVFATLIGVPMYADIFGAIPVAEALLHKGAQIGTVLSLMMAVATLSLPSMVMLRKVVKPKFLTMLLTRPK